MMDDRDFKIAGNMLAIAKKRKGKNKRSIMLRTIMPHLSRDTGDDLADAIEKNDTAKFTNVWNKVRSEITKKIQGHRAHASTAEAEEAAEIREEPENFRGLFPEFEKEFKALMTRIDGKDESEKQD